MIFVCFCFCPISTRFRRNVIFASIKDLGKFLSFTCPKIFKHYWTIWFSERLDKISQGLVLFWLLFLSKAFIDSFLYFWMDICLFIFSISLYFLLPFLWAGWLVGYLIVFLPLLKTQLVGLFYSSVGFYCSNLLIFAFIFISSLFLPLFYS